MRASEDFIMREIAGEFVLVPIGAAATGFNGLVSMNGLGKFIFDLLAEEHTAEELAEKICAEYDVSRETALSDTLEFLQQLREIGALVENR